MQEVRDELIRQVKSRFSDVLNSINRGGDPIWIAASVLDPVTIPYLSDEHIDASVNAIKNIV